MSEKINIAMLGHKRIPSREGGIEIVVEELSTCMVKSGCSVTCYNRSGHHINGSQFDIKAGKEYKGIHLKNVPTIKWRGFAAVTSSFFATLYASFGQYDVIHIHAEGPAVWCWIPRLFGKQVVVTVHGLDWQRAKWKGGWGSKCIFLGEKMAVKYAHEIIVLSNATREYFKKAYNRTVHFIPNGVKKPIQAEANVIKVKFGLEKSSYILYLGRIVPEKGEHYLIEAFKKIETNKKLVIAGGASETDEYMERLKEMASEDSRIIFTGFVQGPMLAELYSNAYIYCLPSDLEGMPLSLLEAMSYGNCCVVSDIAECVEVVEDKAVIFQKGNVELLRKALRELIEDEKKVDKFKAHAAEFICAKYNWEDVTVRTLELYRSQFG